MSELIHINCEQNSAEWHQARAGIPTASCYDTVMAKGKEKNPSKTRQTYLYKLAGEILTGQPSEGFSNSHMERGHVLEPEARALYEFQTDNETTRVGFLRRGDTGCSPDSFVGDKGILEVKTKLPHLMIECLLADRFPPEHLLQCQGELWVSGREWLDIAVYWPRLPLFVKRIEPDLALHRQIDEAVCQFNLELADLVRRLKNRDLKAAA